MDLKIMSARAVKSAVTTIAEDFARASGCAVAFDFAPVGGIEKKLAAGDRTDLVILSRSAIASLDAAGQLLAGSVRELGRTRIGVAVRDGAPRPDIATPEAFKALLLSARSIAVSDPAVGGTAARYLPTLFARMGVAEALAPKLVPCTGGGHVAETVAGGKAEIGLTFISEMLPVAGATVVGPLPAPYGNETAYCAAVSHASAHPELGQALIAALADPARDGVWRAAGLAPGTA